MACSKPETMGLAWEEEEMRSCAFCFHPLSRKEVRKCGKCQRRAYCSKECQAADWKGRNGRGGPVVCERATGVGQGHKHWCDLTVGEEGLDWTIREIPGKGRGLFALRDLPPLYRVLVEGIQKLDQPGLEDHPGFKFLSDPPKRAKITGATALERKFNYNGTGDAINCIDKLGFRFALVNHKCDSNAAAAADRDFGVLIIYTLRPIAAGEEICIQYFGFNWISVDVRPADPFQRALLLLQLHGIRCPSHCICMNIELRTMILEVSVLLQSFKIMEEGRQLGTAVRMVKRAAILAKCLPVHVGALIHLSAYDVCRRHRPSDKNSWVEHFKKYDEWSKAVYHPESKKNHLPDPDASVRKM